MADDVPLRQLERADEARQWSAVGRVNLGGGSFCTGTLIRPDVVLTAAHCFFDSANGRRIPDAVVRFVAGWTQGRGNASRSARAILIHPEYAHTGEVSRRVVSHDLAIIKLDLPVLDTVVRPFNVRSPARRGDEVSVVSYAQDRAQVASIQDVCSVMEREGNISMLSCDVNFGSSGAPVFVISGSEPRVSSIISAVAERDGEAVALAVSVGDALDGLLDQLETSNQGFRPSGQQSLSEQLGRTGGRASTLPQIGTK